MDLKDISTDDLVAEMDKRKKEVGRPKPRQDIKFEDLIGTCEAILQDIVKRGYSKDAADYIYESAMSCIYGPDIWEWINEYDEGC